MPRRGESEATASAVPAQTPTVAPPIGPPVTNRTGNVDRGVDRRRLVDSGSTALALYGMIAAGLALAIGVDSSLALAAVIGAVLVELTIFFIAHAYVDTLGDRYDHPDWRFGTRVSHACRHDIFLLLGGLPILLIFTIERAAGINASTAAVTTLAASTILLGAFSYIAARLAGVTRRRSLVEGLLAVTLGAGVLLLKLLLH